MRSTTAAAAILACLCAWTLAHADEPTAEPVTTARVVAVLKQQFSTACTNARTAVSRSRAKDLDAPKAMQSFNCDCMPTQIDAAFADLPDAGATDQDAVQLRARQAVAVCGRGMVRAMVRSGCASGADPFVRPSQHLVVAPEVQAAHCKCLEAELAKTDDVALIQSAQEAYRNYTAAADARVKGEAPPAHPPSFSEKLQQTCEGDATASPAPAPASAP